jgi:hypothetical protein
VVFRDKPKECTQDRNRKDDYEPANPVLIGFRQLSNGSAEQQGC